MKCKYYSPFLEGELIKETCSCNGDIPGCISVKDELEYYKRATDFLDSLIAGHGGLLDDTRLAWYEQNPFPLFPAPPADKGGA
jgi:hypothetical protein